MKPPRKTYHLPVRSPERVSRRAEESPASHAGSARWRLNVRLLVVSFVLFAAIGGTLAAVHYWQRGRIADALLARASELEEQKRFADAAGTLHQLIKLRPDDSEARVRLAESFDKAARGREEVARAVELYYQALGAAPDRAALRQRLSQRLLELGEYASALEQAQALLAGAPDDGQALRLAALASYGRLVQEKRPLNDQVRESLEKAHAALPGDVYLAVIAAHALRVEGARSNSAADVSAADAVMDRLVESAADDASAWLTRHRYRDRYRLPGTDEDLAEALRRAPDDRVVLLAVAEFAADAKDWSKAADACEKLAAAGAYSPLLCRLWGDAAFAKGEADVAIKRWGEGVKRFPGAHELRLRVAGAHIARRQFAEADAVLKAIEELLSQAPLTAGGREQPNVAADMRMLRARWHVAQNQWPLATPILRELAAAAGATADAGKSGRLAVDACLLLAERESELGRLDLAAEQLMRAVALEPNSVENRLQLARALSAAGDAAGALRHAEAGVEQNKKHAEARLLVAQLLVAQQGRIADEERDLVHAREVVLAVEALLPRDYRVELLKLSLANAAGDLEKPERTQEALRELAGRFPDEAALQSQLVMWFERLEAPADADRALGRLAAIAPAETNTFLRRGELLLARGQVEEAQKVLLAAEEWCGRKDRHELARLWMRLETSDKSIAPGSSLARLVNAWPEDAQLVLWLGETALGREDVAGVKQAESRLSKLEGDEGSGWRYLRARRLIGAEKITAAEEAELAAITKWLEQSRPNWPQSWIVAGMAAERAKAADRAIEAYRRAVALDEQRINVYERLMTLLYQRGRYEEIAPLVAGLKARGQLSDQIANIEIGAAAAQNEFDQATALAKATAESDASNIPAALWLSHLLLVQGEAEAGEKVLLRLVENHGSDQRAWSGLLTHYHVRGERAAFSRTLEACAADERLMPVAKAPLLAHGYGLLGNGRQSAAYYQQALSGGKDDGALRLRLAGAQLSFDPALAETTLRAICAESPNSLAARRMLAIALAATKRDNVWPEIQSLLTGDSRLEAFLHLQGSEPAGAAQARKLLERLIAEAKTPAAQDRVLLAALFEQENNIAAARREYLAAAESADAAPQHWQALVIFLLKQKDAATAIAWIDRLAERKTDRVTTRQMRALALAISGDNAGLDRLLSQAEHEDVPPREKPAERAQSQLQLANLYEHAKRPADVERIMRTLTSEQPAYTYALVRWLITNKRMTDAVNEALAACEKSADAENVAALVESLQAGGATGAVMVRAERLFARLAKEVQDPGVLLAISNHLLADERPNEAMALLERIVELFPNHVIALNNLAALLADRRGSGNSALASIDRAIALSPRPQAFLMDTRAKVLLHQDRAADALKQLESITARWPDADPRVYFHLAMAYDRSGRVVEARNALTTARERGLNADQLTPGDRTIWLELDQRLARAVQDVDEVSPLP